MYLNETKVRNLLKKSGALIGKHSGQVSARRHGACVGAYPGTDLGEGWVQVWHRPNGDPDVPKVNGVIPPGAEEQVRQLKEAQYHQILTNAGFEHKVVSYFAQRPMNLYRKAE